MFWRDGASIVSRALVFVKLMGNHKLSGDPFLDLDLLLFRNHFRLGEKLQE